VEGGEEEECVKSGRGEEEECVKSGRG
jgi:hypothetical protein